MLEREEEESRKGETFGADGRKKASKSGRDISKLSAKSVEKPETQLLLWLVSPTAVESGEWLTMSSENTILCA